MEKEVWKDILGCEGRYQISNLGRVKSMYCGKERILKPSITNWGYERIRIVDNSGKKVSLRVHRLVAQAFVPNPKNKPEVNHEDSNKLNNRAENLSWVTASENKLHDIQNNGTCPWNLKSRKCRCIETGEEYHSVNYAAKVKGVSKTQLREHLNGNRSCAGNLHWEYVDN